MRRRFSVSRVGGELPRRCGVMEMDDVGDDDDEEDDEEDDDDDDDGDEDNDNDSS